MRLNRSVPPCSVIPVLIYPDPGAAADWLSKAFGFTIRLRIANHRIQMKAGDGCFTIAEGKTAPNNSHVIQVRIEDARGHCQRARQNGATARFISSNVSDYRFHLLSLLLATSVHAAMPQLLNCQLTRKIDTSHWNGQCGTSTFDGVATKSVATGSWREDVRPILVVTGTIGAGPGSDVELEI